MRFPLHCTAWAHMGALSLITLTLIAQPALSAETDTESSVGAVGGAVHADPFTGTATTSIPIEVPPGRGGIQPDLSLVYSSGNGNGWVGNGWKLEKGVIERQTKFGVNYSGDDYVFRLSGINVELVNVGSGEYRAKIENNFSRIKKLTATDGKPYFEATDKTGTKFIFGSASNTRLTDPGNANNIFRWCLERVEDTQGNYMTLSYTSDQGQGYLSQIDYTGNNNGGLLPTNQVKFFLENRVDATPMYTTNFKMTTAKRLKTIELKANGTRTAAYKLTYNSSDASTISQIKRYGKDAVLDGSGNVTGGTSLPAFTVDFPSIGSFFSTGTLWASGNPLSGTDLTGVADMNGDGKADIVLGRKIFLSTGTTFTGPHDWGVTGNALGDVNGDGKADLIYIDYEACAGGCPLFVVWLSTGTGYSAPTTWAYGSLPFGTQMTGVDDVNGDGKADLVLGRQVYLSTGTSFAGPYDWGVAGGSLADLNGDGKADLISILDQGCAGGCPLFLVSLSTGTSFTAPAEWAYGAQDYYTFLDTGDVNGDGKADLIFWHYGYAVAEVYLSTGYSMIGPYFGGTGAIAPQGIGDVNGDGKADAIQSQFPEGCGGGCPLVAVSLSEQSESNTLTFNNGYGASTTVNFETINATSQVPFPLQTVSSIASVDGNGHTATTTYAYSEPFHYWLERDFRGFHKTKITGQAGPSGEQTITETWFHQGNDTGVDVNNPNVAHGYLKGTPYRTKVTDGAGTLYSESTTTYQADDNGQAPFFTPPSSVVNTICDGTGCGKQTRTDFTYDTYGNITREDQHGDTGTNVDNRTVTRTYSPNTTAWILGLPTTEIIYEGLDTAVQVARTDFYYDGTTSCSSPSSNQQPTKGNLTRVVKWLSGGTSPETRMAYDAYGNVTCTRDPRGNPTTLVYDTTSQTFALSVTNPLGHITSTKYYGVDGEPVNTGLYGQVKTVTDSNGAITTSEYDALGRRTKVTQPNGFWTTMAYNSFGTVGSQHVYSTSSLGLSSWTYFDGLGRTIKTRSTGPDSKIIVSEVRYDNRGAVTQQSLPVFEPATPTQWKTFLYDPLGRTLRATNPDTSRGLYCYDDWVTVSIDANNHRRRTVSDAYSRVLMVQEYSGTYAACDTSVGSPYATTTYTYDVLGNLKTVTDAKGNISSMTYDTLSRKTAMHDPDMGNWSYLYDAAGNLTQQTDAKNQNIYFQYDALNRRQQKDYGTQKALGSGNVNYVYDGATDFRTGRLQKVLDGAGITTFYYNNMGEVIRTDKAVSGVTYTTQTTYDGLGRVLNLTYPDLSVVTHTYNGPQLWQVKEGTTTYASYGGFNAQGQPGTLTLGNGTATTYTYDPNNYRLKTLMTEKAAFIIQNLTYTFDAGGNITTLADPMPGHKNQTFVYDALDRLTSAGGPYGGVYYSYDQIGNMLSNSRLGSYTYPASGSSSVRPHAVTTAGGNTYTYDANGNMTGGAGRTISYDYENRPVTIGAETLAGPEWIMKGAGDTDGDSKTDLVWRNASTGDAAIWRMNGTTRISAGIVASPGQTLDIKGVGDVDGDGKADLIWRDSNTGTVTIWLMNGATVTASGVAGGVGLNWTIQGIGDTNGDGKADIVWRDTSGTTAIWLMNGTTMSSAGYPGGAGLNWIINGVGDTNGDGKADLVWRDTNSGATAIWFMNGTTMSSAGYPGGAGLDWSITNVGDTNGDGKADLVWRHTNGTVSVWLLNGASVQQTGQPGAAGMEWALKSVGDVDGDGKGDLIWQNTTTGLTTPTSYIWVLNGTTVQSFNGQAPWWVPGPTTTTYVYDGDGGRVKKTVGPTTTTYIGKLYVCEGTACAKMIFAGGQRIAIKQVNSGSTSYFHPDHLGSTSLLTNSSGVKEEDVVYYPYGESFTNTGTANVAYKYTGKELDDSTGLYFYEARYYDAVLGRFISADSIVPSATDPQSLNRYAYAANNPVLYNDPSGHCPICIGIAIGAIVGGVSAGIQSDWNFGSIITGTVIGGALGAISGGAYGAAYSTLVDNLGYSLTSAAILAGVNGGFASYAAQGFLGPWGGWGNGNPGLSLAASVAGGVVSGGFQAGGLALGGTWGSGGWGNIISAPAVGAVSAAIIGEDPGKGALLGLLKAGLTIGAGFIFSTPPFLGNQFKEGEFKPALEYHENLAENSRYDIGKDGVTLTLQGTKALKNSLVVDIHLSEINRNGISWQALGIRAVYPEHTFFGTFNVPPYNGTVTITIPYGDWNYGKVLILPFEFNAGKGQNPAADFKGGGTLIFCSSYPCR